ncbi:hypothetical protein TcasGA2_TC003411 [Tribolium castaneum]|uniref:Uncharacterized protein n=1 Tax=Tribolium castaneum TaxID=7070 RepID=D6WG83_TRICA|nr:hypothetical protein TcasGA2_TC003411 [Tribolium castaneum]
MQAWLRPISDTLANSMDCDGGGGGGEAAGNADKDDFGTDGTCEALISSSSTHPPSPGALKRFGDDFFNGIEDTRFPGI